MIKSIKVVGIKYEVDDNTNKYAIKRIGNLDKYIPKHARKTVSAEVKLMEVDHDHGNKFQAEVIINLPGKIVTAKDSTINMLSAIDIVEAKIKIQLIDYKSTAISHIGNRGLMSRFKRSFQREL